MADKYVDKNATGNNDGTDWANAYNTDSGLQDAYSAMTAGDTIHARAGTFSDKLQFFLYEWTLKLYGDVVVDSAGEDDQTLHHNVNASGRIVTDGNVWGFTLQNADTTRYNYYSENSSLVCSSRVLFIVRGNSLTTGSSAGGLDIVSTSSVLLNVPNLSVSGFGTGVGVGLRGAGDINGTIQNFVMDDCQRIYNQCTGTGTLTIVDSVLGGTTSYILDSSATATNTVDILNCTLYPMKDFQSTKNILDDDGGVFRLGAVDYYPQWYSAGAALGTPGTDLGLNRERPLTDYITNTWLAPRRPHYISLTTDDYINLDEFKYRAGVLAAKGWKHNILLDDTVLVTAPDWAEMATYVDAGHEIVAHSRRETIWTQNLYALNIANTTGADIYVNISLSGNSLKVGTASGLSDLLNTTLSGDLAAMFTTISAETGLTGAASTADVTSSLWGNSLANTLADVTDTVVATGANADFALDAQRHFDEEVAGSVTDIETNITGYTCRGYGYVGGYNDVSHNSLFHAAGLLGARATVSNLPTDVTRNFGSLEKNYVYNSCAVNIEDLLGGSPKGTTATREEARDAVYSLVLLAKQHGLHVDLYGHPDTEVGNTQFGYVVDALEEANANVVTLTQAYATIRSAGTLDIANDYTYTRDLSSNDLQHLKSFTGVGAGGTGEQAIISHNIIKH